jgi:hypothetical protein
VNSARQRKYWWLFGPVRDYLRGKGYSPKQIEERRHALHRKALGADKSSKDFTDADFDAVKRVFRAEWDGGNLDAQLAAEDEPQQRRQAIVDRCLEATGDMHALGDSRLSTRRACLGYIGGTARKVIGKELDQCTEAELGTVFGCLQRRVRVLRSRNPDAAAALDSSRPF